MWTTFVDYRLDPKTKAMSEKNHENRSKLKMPHTCGSKSMARKKHEMELASGKPVSRGVVFVATRKRKDGSYVNDNAKIVSLEANKSQTKSFMTFVLRNLGLESVPPEFADLINPQVHKPLDGLVSRTLGYLVF
ncbi:uncharacterized protein G2W53_040321 [Senna tora]|uniref:Uncharacterized protein n=1 Tax=Senna tora TaxID=362788 RepID=A0A834W3M2_9FABA|nr:uncharacterized protein G2W53_040321 [Senna tora]